MLEQIKQLELTGDLVELHRLAETLPAGDALARVYIALSKLQEDAATTGAEYRQALGFAQRAVAAAGQGGLMWTWAQGRTAALSADLGMYPAADKAACAFLEALPGQPKAETLLPWVYFALARVKSARRDYRQALAYYALVEAPTGALAEQVRLNVVWAYARSGRALAAFHALPDAVEHVGIDRLHATRAAVFAAAGDWTTARLEAQAALKHGRTRLFDLVETAELYLILRGAAIKAGDQNQAAIWLEHTAVLLGRDQDLIDTLAPIPPAEGGVLYSAATSRCGASGIKPMGLLGAVG